MRMLWAVLFVAACGPDGRDPSDTPDASTNVDAPPSTDFSRVYAHSGETLYRLDALTLSATPIGAMTGLAQDEGLLDLAVDSNDRLVGISRTKLYSLSSSNGAATLIRDLSASAQGFTSLSYVPALSNGSPDILVSANDQGDVFQIDETTGNATKIGNYGTVGAGKVVSSGDLFGVKGLGIYATVNVGTNAMDYLARIDPTTWVATPLPNATGYDKIFGLGFWGGKIYGFVDDGYDAGTGKMIQIDSTTGTATMLSTGGVRWFGAGVATDAPILQ